MSSLYTLLFRSFLSFRKQSASALFSLLVVAGIVIGAASLIIALSVLRGFEQTMQTMLVSNSSHITIKGFDYQEIPVHPLVDMTIKQTCGAHLASLDPYIQRAGILKKGDSRDGIILKAIAPEKVTARPGFKILAGTFPSSDTLQLMPGKPLAEKLGIQNGDMVSLFVMKNTRLPSETNLPEIVKVRVSGIYESGISKFDETTVYTSFNSFTAFSGQTATVSGYEILLRSVDSVKQLTGFLQSQLGYPFYVRNFYQDYQHIFTWLELQRQPVPIVLGLIMLVAVFNIISALIIVALERRKSIGIYLALGAKRRNIRAAFLLQGAMLGVCGAAGGSVFALLLMYLQDTFQIITLPGSVYFFSKVPLAPNLNIFLIVCGVTLLLSIIASLLPAFKSGNSQPVDLLRYE